MPMLIPAAIALAATWGAVTAGVVVAGSLAAAAVGFGAYAISSFAVGMNQQRKAEKAARNAWNAQVQDRAVTVKSGDFPASSIYGRALVGGVLAHIQSTGTSGEYLHLVIGISRREIDEIEGVYFNGELLPAENGSTGFIESGNYTVTAKTTYKQQQGPGSGTTITLANTPSKIISIGTVVPTGYGVDAVWTSTEWVLTTDYTVAGNVITLLGGKTATTDVFVIYEYQTVDYLVRIRKVFGAAGQVAFSELVSESGGKWTSNHIGVGNAAVYIRLKYNVDVFGQIGIPDIKFKVRGFKVYDPRSGLTVWSQNSALCTADYLKDTVLGVGAASADVPDSEVTAAANICDQEVDTAVSTFTANASTDEITHSLKIYTSVRMFLTTTGTLPAGLSLGTTYYAIRTGATTCKLATSLSNAWLGIAVNITGTGSGTHTVTTKQPRYTANGALPSDSTPKENLAALTDSMAGICVWTAGRWLVRAGAGRTSEFTITESYLADDAVSIRPRPPRRELFNAVTGVFIDPQNNYTATQFSAVENATYVTNDGGRRKARDLSFLLSDDNIRSQRLAKIALERARQGMLVKIACNYLAYDLVVSDWVTLNIPRYFGVTPKVFEVVEREWIFERGLVYTLQETASTVYDWAYGEATTIDLAPNTSLPSPFVAPAILTGMAASSGTSEIVAMADGTLVTRVLLSWTQSTDVFVTQGGKIEVQYSRPLDPELWTSSPSVNGADASTYIFGAPDGVQILIRIRAVNSAGRSGPWQYLSHVVIGKTAVPSDVAGLAATKVTNGVRIDWTAATDVDYMETELRRGGTGWSDATPLVGSTAMGVRGNTYLWVPAAGTYTIRAKHRDTSGNVSSGTASVSITVSAADLLEWIDIAGRPAMFRVAANGYGSTTHPIVSGLYNAETGASLVAGVTRSYMLAKITRSTGAIASSQWYDVYSAGATSPNRLEDLVTDLNSATSSQIVVVFTYDEPQGRRLLLGLPAALYRNGASQAVFGSPQFKARSSYILVGIGGCGEGNGYEAYQGSVDSDTNAWCDVSFYLQNGNLVISGSAATPRTLADYSYTGELDATRGAVAGTNLRDQYGSTLYDYAFKNNLIDTSFWAVGAAVTSTGWALHPGATSNTFVVGTGPDGQSAIFWKAIADSSGGGSGSGGWEYDNPGITIDKTKTYRFAIAIYRDAAASGTAFWGIQPNSVCDLNTTTPQGNPYFVSGFSQVARWCLCVGYVFPYGSTGNSNAGSGLYDMTTGVLLGVGLNFNWANVSFTSTRAYQHYSSSGSAQWFDRPCVELVDGSERSLSALLAVGSVSARNAITASNVLSFVTPGAMTTPGTASYNTTIYSGSAITFISTYYADGPTLTIAAGSRIFASCSGRVGWQINTTTLRYINPSFRLQLVNTAGTVVYDESGYFGDQIPMIRNTSVWTTTDFTASLVFDAQAAGTYKVRLRVDGNCTDDTLGFQSNIVNVNILGEVSAVEYKV